MLAVQGSLWVLSLLIHIFAIPSVVDMISARQALDRGDTNQCICEVCEIPETSNQTIVM